jgi:ribonuclease HI
MDLPRHIANTFECLSRYQAQSKQFVSSAVFTILAMCYKDQHISPAPPKKYAMMKFDGASQGNPGPGGCGAVLIETIQGRPIATAFTARYIADRSNTNNAAEYRALLDGLELAKDHNISHLRIIGDSELVVNQTKGIAKVSSRLRAMANKVQHWFTHFQAVTISNVRREYNQAADFLSKLRKHGEDPLINHPIAGWADADTLLLYLQADYQYPPKAGTPT